jgi:hypothetical protein
MLLSQPNFFDPNASVCIELAKDVHKPYLAASKFSSSENKSLDKSVDKSPRESSDKSLEELMEEPWPPEPTFLQAKNPHPLDWAIKFVEDSHTYYVAYENNNCHTSEFNISVSEFVHQFFPVFDPDSQLDYMRENWKFYQNFYHDMTNNDIKKSWDDIREKASRQGRFYHLLLESACNGLDLSQSKYKHLVPVKQYLRWRKEFFDPYFEEFRTEFRMHSSSDLRIVGTADLIAVRKNHLPPSKTNGTLHLIIFDWKNTKNLQRTSKKRKFGFGPCSQLSDCNFYHYSCQQNLYKYLLETFYPTWYYNGHMYTSVKVDFMQLIVIHDNHIPNEAHAVHIPDLTNVTKQMIAIRRKDLAEKMALQNEKEVTLIPVSV